MESNIQTSETSISFDVVRPKDCFTQFQISCASSDERNNVIILNIDDTSQKGIFENLTANSNYTLTAKTFYYDRVVSKSFWVFTSMFKFKFFEKK